MESFTAFFPPVLGLGLLLMGRRLFWVFVGAAGFAAGLQFSPLILGPQPFWVIWAAGLVFGLIGILLALFFQKAAIIVGGFLAGLTLGAHLLPMVRPDLGLIVSLACGIAGSVALFLAFDWVLILLSAVIGAGLIVDGLPMNLPATHIVYVLLAAVGVAVQFKWSKGRGK